MSSGQSGTDRGLYYYEYNGTWSGPTTLIADADPPNRGGHVNVTTDGTRIYIVWECSDGTADCYTWDGTTLSSKIDISNDNMPKISLMGSTLYVVSIEDGTGDIEVYSAAAASTPSFSTHSTAIPGAGLYDPCIFGDGTNLYVVTAPYVGGNDQQYLIQAYYNGSTWSSDKAVSAGGYGGVFWWDYWPIGYWDGTDLYVFFTTETASPTYSDAEIAFIKMDWNLDNDHFFYIKNAVDPAADGDVINIAAGTYTEQVVVDGKDISLDGAGQAVTNILAPATLADCFTTGSNANRPIVCVKNAGNVAISEMTVDGMGLGNANYRFIGVAYRNAGGSVTNCEVTGIRETPLNGNQHGVGIYAFADDGNARTLSVSGCTITDYQKNAMALNGPDLSVDVSGNTCTGAGPTPVIAQNGIQLAWGTGGTVTGNAVSGHTYTGESWTSSGLLLYGVPGYGWPSAALSGNSVSDNQTNVYIQDMDASTSGGSASGSANTGWSFIIYNSTASLTGEGRVAASPVDGQDQDLPGRPDGGPRSLMSVSVDGVSIVGTGVTPDAVGIDASSGAGGLNLSVVNSSVKAWDYGMVIWDDPVTLQTDNNDISGNISAGLSNQSSVTQQAVCNWWGDIGGPDAPPANPNPAGDDIEGSVVYWPWLDAVGGNCDEYGSTNVAADMTGVPCVSVDIGCVTVPVKFNRPSGSPAVRGYSVTFQLSSELELCAGSASVVEGSFLCSHCGTCSPSTCTQFYIVDNGGGSYTVDCAILGPGCGPTGGGTLFTLDVKKSGTADPEDTGTITVTEVIVRDCSNAPLAGIPGPPAEVTIDTSPPVAVTDLAATQVKSGNDGNGTTKITLTFTAPGDASVREVYRAPYHSGGTNTYPEYDDVGGAGPPSIPAYPPGAPWTLTTVTATGQTDEPAARGFWYYVVFTKDACGNVSAVSNMTDGTLNYHLGDIASGGDNVVNTTDISALSATYGLSEGAGSYNNEADVGPTTDYSVDGRPTTDNVIDFEDLMMFAINFSTVGLQGPPPSVEIPGDVAERVRLVLETEGGLPRPGGVMSARLILTGASGVVKGLHGLVSYDPAVLELEEVVPGELIADQALPVFFEDLQTSEGAVVDAAVLGPNGVFEGTGEVAVLRFRVRASGSSPRLAEAVLRDAANHPVGAGAVGTPLASRDGMIEPLTMPVTETRFLGARPNPFSGRTAFAFELPRSARVELRIFDVAGRLIRTLAEGEVSAGRHHLTWDGRGEDGRLVGGGMYMYSFRAGDLTASGKIFSLK